MLGKSFLASLSRRRFDYVSLKLIGTINAQLLSFGGALERKFAASDSRCMFDFCKGIPVCQEGGDGIAGGRMRVFLFHRIFVCPCVRMCRPENRPKY